MLIGTRITCAEHALQPDWWQLYEAAFPRSERRNAGQHAAALAHPHFHVLHLADATGFVGLLSYWQWDELAFVEHLAIVPERRGQGLGRRALSLLNDAQVILEIEPVVDAGTARRLAFYESCGFSRLPQLHIQLAYQAGEPDIPLWLLSRPMLAAGDVERFEKLYAAGPMRSRDEA